MKFYSGITLVLGIICMAGLTQSATITVGETNSSYSSIQNAIYDAEMGDIIEVYPGAYFENVYVDKNVTLRGVGDSMPIVDAAGKGAAITLLTDGITLERLHVVNSSGGGIEVYSNNNIITANYVDQNLYGIYLINSNNNSISNNIASGNVYVGIEVDGSSSNIIRNNVVDNNSAARYNHTEPSGYGISLSDSSYNTIAGNTIKDNQLDALILLNSLNNSISDNLASNNKEGIYLYKSNGSIVDNNSAKGSLMTGIFVEKSFFCTIKNNSVKYNKITGLNLWKSANNTLRNNHIIDNKYNFDAGGPNDIDTSNLIDGKKIFYLVGRSNLVIDETSQAGTVYCIDCNNITVNGLDIRANDVGVYFQNTSNSSISNNHIVDIEGGIFLSNSKHNIVTGNTIRNCLNNSIFVGYSSDDNVIQYNNVSNSEESGIAVQEAWINTIRNNTAINNSLYGIGLFNSSRNTITGNTVKDNHKLGIFINGTSMGNNISENKIISNLDFEAYDIIFHSLNQSPTDNVYINNDYINSTEDYKTTDPYHGAEDPYYSNTSKVRSNDLYASIEPHLLYSLYVIETINNIINMLNSYNVAVFV